MQELFAENSMTAMPVLNQSILENYIKKQLLELSKEQVLILLKKD